MSEEDELEKWRKERGIPDEELQFLSSPELRMLRLFEKLTERVVTNEEEASQRDERIKRNIDFITQQQAQFTADMQQLRETQANAERKWVHTEESVRHLHAIAQIHEREINNLMEVQLRTHEQIRESQERTDRQMAETDRRMAETDERLNALINFVERHVAEGRNGGQQT